MADAVAPFAPEAYITPMAAVAGSVAEENSGGDDEGRCAQPRLRQQQRRRYRAASAAARAFPHRDDRSSRPGRLPFGRVEITGEGAVRGVATSGRHGRSFSFGIADAVTVLAASASAADAAATIVANAVDLPGHPEIHRAAAIEFDPQSDLGERLVTRDVGLLSADEIASALSSGWREAERLRLGGEHHRGCGVGHLRGETRICDASAAVISGSAAGEQSGGDQRSSPDRFTPARINSSG